jgi:hypothetical protein
MQRHSSALRERVDAPVGAVPKGGYELDALADSGMRHDATARRRPATGFVAPDLLTTRAASYIGHYWRLRRPREHAAQRLVRSEVAAPEPLWLAWPIGVT